MRLFKRIERLIFPCTRRLDIEIARHHAACKRAQRAVVMYGPRIIALVTNTPHTPEVK